MKYWVFDLDGTLSDSFGHYFSLIEELIGQQLSKGQKKIMIGMHPAQIFKSKLPSNEVDKALAILQKRSNEDAISIPLFDEIYQLCFSLKQYGRNLAVWTSRDLQSATLLLENRGIRSLVDIIISGECVSNRKPNPEGLIRIQSSFGCASTEMIMVGDHDHDMEAANELGVVPVRASWHTHWNHDPCQKSHHQFFKVSEFRDWAESTVVISKETQV